MAVPAQQSLLLDPLTGTANRFHFIQSLEKIIQQAKDQPYILAYIDIDNFNTINLNYGKQIGDKILKQLAQNLTQWLGSNEQLARIENDDFLALLPQPHAASVQHHAQELLAVINRPMIIDNHEFKLTASLGMSVYPAQGQEVYQLIKNASLALEDAKSRGGAAFQIFSQRIAKEPHTITLDFEIELKNALRNNEFLLHYQPIYDLNHDSMCGVEALLRWQHPHRGLMYPEVFLPNTEVTGLILPIGEWVLFTAAQQIKQWHQRGLPLTLAVNFSPRQFSNSGFYQFILQTLRIADLPPHFLQIEITENLILQNMQQHAKKIQALRARGVQLAIDNFGSDFGSFNQLNQLAFSAVKIDRHILFNCQQDEVRQNSIATIIAMAKQLNLKVYAEGVENKEQYNFLKSAGCDYMQGFYLSLPIAAEDLEKKWLH